MSGATSPWLRTNFVYYDLAGGARFKLLLKLTVVVHGRVECCHPRISLTLNAGLELMMGAEDGAQGGGGAASYQVPSLG